MTWSEIKIRLKSPVVLVQLVSIICSMVAAFSPNSIKQIDIIIYSLTAIINLFAGVNNPSDKDNF